MMICESKLLELSGIFSRLQIERVRVFFPTVDSKVEQLEQLQGHTYRNRGIAIASLIHRSSIVYWGEHEREGVFSNEKLEFLGDALLGHYVTIEAMCAHPELNEGELSRLRAALVGTESLGQKAAQLGLGKLLLMGKSELANGGGRRQTILADAFEATTAALFLDGGIDRAWQWLTGQFHADLILAQRILDDFDAKTRFQQWTQGVIGVAPTYRVVGTESTPEETVFIVAGFVLDREIARAKGRNKREASKRAAVLMQEQAASGKLTESDLREIRDRFYNGR